MKIVKGLESAKPLFSREVMSAVTISPEMRQSIMERYGIEDIEQTVAGILYDVFSKGDDALREYTIKFNQGLEKLDTLQVSPEQIKAAYKEVDAKLLAALKLAAKRVENFHQQQAKGILKGVAGMKGRQMARALKSVGVYAPGGTAFYPSTVLMTAIPAKVAGVEEIILATPPSADGCVPAPTLVAADIAGVNKIFSIGGAEAVAALAYGTKSVPAVDKICGPGNIFVTMAKKMVFGTVDIDGLNGPSEVVIIADDTTNANYCVSELLAQAEHDPMARPMMITTSEKLAHEVSRVAGRAMENLPRKDIIKSSFEEAGVIAVVDSIDEAIELSNEFAPEHLCLLFEGAEAYLDKITNAGCVFTGKRATVALGDYVDGPSHALPTGGTARYSSPLNVNDFIKLIDVVKVDDAVLAELGSAAVTIARAEGLEAHAVAVEKRLKDIAEENKKNA